MLENFLSFPCNADYYRSRGYVVHEREYGTRQYKEMFTIEDSHGEPWIEIRRNPASGDASFKGLVNESSHIRLVNRQCYYDDCIERFRQFLLKHQYIFKRIYRIDVALDFEKFDTGDMPAAFCQRYVSRVYAKINQCKLAARGVDNWASCEWETLSWGAQKSMVSTKIYNKSKELKANKTDKPYIKWAWFVNGLVDNPTTMERKDKDGKVYVPDIWRIEFSMKSSAKQWIVIEETDTKGTKRKRIPHDLSLFDSKDKQWARFRDLAQHYFRFKILENGVRKDRCKDKVLFRWGEVNEFRRVTSLPSDSKQNSFEVSLSNKLRIYMAYHADSKIRNACKILLQSIDDAELRRIAPREEYMRREGLQRTIALKMGMPNEDAAELIKKVQLLLFNNEIF